MAELMRMKEEFGKEAERKGLGSAVFRKDSKPKSKKFKKGKDDGDRVLHPARFLSLPRSEPARYWDKVPTGQQEIYRHLPLQHLGVEGVPEATIVKLHDRRVPIELAMLSKDATEVRHVEKAVYSYVVIMRCLHPIDPAALALQGVLVEAGWAANIGDGEKQRVQILRRFFDDALRENSGRAVRGEPPLSYEEGNGRWLKAVTAVLPNMSLMSVGQQMAAIATAGRQQPQPQKKPAAGKASQGGQGQAVVAKGGSTNSRTPARHNGMPVCFGYNGASGCGRLAPGTQAAMCVAGSSSFAHVCNFWLKATPGKAAGHCLASHPRVGNH